MLERRESNLVSSGAAPIIDDGSTTQYTASRQQVQPVSHSASAQSLHEQPVGFAIPKYTKPNLNALGTNQKDTHFSSVKWGGTPNASLNNFTRTMKR